MPKQTSFAPTWDLDSLMPAAGGDDFARILDAYRDSLLRIAEKSEELPPVSGDREVVSRWVDFLKEFEAIEGRARDLKSFVGCHASADAGNRKLQTLEAALAFLDPLRERMATNVELALQTVDDEEFSGFVAADPWLKQRAFFLEQSRKDAAFRLPKAEELLAAELAVDGIHAWGRLYDRISGALRIPVMERGEIVEKSPGQVQFDSPQRAVRENHFFAADKAWRTIADTCADALNHISGARLTVYRRLGLRDHLEAPLRRNRLQRETLNVMWQAVARRKQPLAEYLKRKARILGLEKPAWYDIPAPLVASASDTVEVDYDEACACILRAFEEFNSECGAFARRALNERWIEAENRSGKRQGGFCTDFPGKQQSRIFMTFTNSPESMSTLAHELGHAYHTFVLCDQPVFLQQYPMNLAETASTFAESLLAEQRLRETQDAGQQLAILESMLSDAVVFLMNIHARFQFEDRFYGERAAGEVAVDRLCELMLEAQQDAYSHCLADDGWNPSFWISKLHFYISTLPFYNFPYTFGYILSLGLQSLAQEKGADFSRIYREFLIATGSQETEDAAQSALGFELGKAAFWDKCLDVVESRVEKFLRLTS